MFIVEVYFLFFSFFILIFFLWLSYYERSPAFWFMNFIRAIERTIHKWQIIFFCRKRASEECFICEYDIYKRFALWSSRLPANIIASAFITPTRGDRAFLRFSNPQPGSLYSLQIVSLRTYAQKHDNSINLSRNSLISRCYDFTESFLYSFFRFLCLARVWTSSIGGTYIWSIKEILIVK